MASKKPLRLAIGELSRLEGEIRRAMREARAILEAASFDADEAKRLMASLADCAEKAASCGLHFSEQRLDRMADRLERRVRLCDQSMP
jgi:hypothetical protein